MARSQWIRSWLPALALLSLAAPALAEPYLAVRQGLACSACHVNPTGAGMRTAFGNVFSQQQLPAVPLPPDAAPWNGSVAERFAFGANARAAARQTELDDRDDHLDFGIDRVTLYLGADLGPTYLYVDQQVAPGGALNREAWALLRRGKWYAKAGRMFLPYGWRLQDDTALIREATGISLNQGDDGLELGFERTGFSWQLAVTNGNGGGPEVDDGKQFTTRAALIRSRWQGGISGLRNDTDFGQTTAAGLFVGVRTGPVSWLAESDYVRDDPEERPCSGRGGRPAGGRRAGAPGPEPQIHPGGPVLRRRSRQPLPDERRLRILPVGVHPVPRGGP